MDDKNFSLVVLMFIFMVAVPSMIFLVSDSSVTGQASNDNVLYSWVYDGKEVFVYPYKIVVYDFANPHGTGFHYDTPIFQVNLDKRMGCPKDCYSIRHEDVQNLQKAGFRIDFYGDRLYCCWCPEEY